MNNTESVQNENRSIKSKGIISATGEFSISGNLTISGIFTGKLNVEGRLIIRPGSRVVGEIVANDLDLYGRLKGNILVLNQAEFANGSDFSGYIQASEAIFQNGCTISGNQDFGSFRLTESYEIKEMPDHKKFNTLIHETMEQTSFWTSPEEYPHS
jgi:cytoskeletal protein CcmA (bactofilin family)